MKIENVLMVDVIQAKNINDGCKYCRKWDDNKNNKVNGKEVSVENWWKFQEIMVTRIINYYEFINDTNVMIIIMFMMQNRIETLIYSFDVSGTNNVLIRSECCCVYGLSTNKVNASLCRRINVQYGISCLYLSVAVRKP